MIIVVKLYYISIDAYKVIVRTTAVPRPKFTFERDLKLDFSCDDVLLANHCLCGAIVWEFEFYFTT